MMDFELRMGNYLKLIDEELDNYLSFTDNKYDNTIEAMRYSGLDSGKKIRPILTLEFCRINGGDILDALPFACALEMIHCSSLIHDDMPCMDDDDLRRGKLSCHKKYGEAIALLAGDSLLIQPFDIVSRENKFNREKPHLAIKAINELAKFAGIYGMMGGQAIDLASVDKEIDFETLKQMHNLKTAALIKAACRMGSVIAGANEEQILKAGDYAQNLGLAFQTIDDILDVIGNQEELGKPIGSDQEKNKATYVSLFGLEKAKEMASEYTVNALKAIKDFDDNKFLIKLTENLLNRTK